MFPRSCRHSSSVIYSTMSGHRLQTVQQLCGQYLIQQAKLGVLLLWVFTARIRVFLHQEHVSLFTLEKKKNCYYIKNKEK